VTASTPIWVDAMTALLAIPGTPHGARRLARRPQTGQLLSTGACPDARCDARDLVPGAGDRSAGSFVYG